MPSIAVGCERPFVISIIIGGNLCCCCKSPFGVYIQITFYERTIALFCICSNVVCHSALQCKYLFGNSIILVIYYFNHLGLHIRSFCRRKVVHKRRLGNLFTIGYSTHTAESLATAVVADENANHICTHLINCNGIVAVAVAATGEAKVIVAVNHCAVYIEHINTKNLQTVVAACVVERDGVVACLAEHKIATRAKDRALCILCQALDVGRYFTIFGSPSPRRGTVPSLEHERLKVGCLACCLNTHRSFETGKYFIAGNNSTTGVTNHCGGLLAIDVLHGVNHRSNGIHCNIGGCGYINLGAHIVRTVAQHSTPLNAKTVFVSELRHQLLPCKTL